METIEVVYLSSAFISVVAMAPQVKQLWLTKQSDELNLTTWVLWTLAQCVALVYSLSLNALPYFVANLAWVTFYLIMVTMIIKFRTPKHRQLAFETINVGSLDEQIPLSDNR